MYLFDFIYSKILKKETPYYFKKYSVLKLIWKQIRKFLNVSIIPFIPFNSIRIILYRLVGYKIGKHVFIGMQCYLDDYYPEKLIIEDHVTISYRVTFATHGPKQGEGAPIILKKHCYVGVGALILPGVTIGEHSIVAGGAVVIKDVPPSTIVGGVPAVKIKDYQHSN